MVFLPLAFVTHFSQEIHLTVQNSNVEVSFSWQFIVLIH